MVNRVWQIMLQILSKMETLIFHCGARSFPPLTVDTNWILGVVRFSVSADDVTPRPHRARKAQRNVCVT